MEYATLTISPDYGDWRLTGDGKDHNYSGIKSLNDLAEKGWRVIGNKYLEKAGYKMHEWHLLLERDTCKHEWLPGESDEGRFEMCRICLLERPKP